MKHGIHGALLAALALGVDSPRPEYSASRNPYATGKVRLNFDAKLRAGAKRAEKSDRRRRLEKANRKRQRRRRN